MLLTPTLTILASLVFAWVVLRSKIRLRFLFDFFAFLPHAVPDTVFAIGAVLLALFVLRGFIPLYGTLSLLLLLYIVVRLSYGTRMMNSSLIQIHRELEEAAYVAAPARATSCNASSCRFSHAAYFVRLVVDRFDDLS